MAGTPVLVHAGSAVLQWQCRRSNGGLWFNNYPEFEEELLLLLNNENLRMKMADAGRNYVLTEYSRNTVKTRMLDFLDAQ
jgi:glycosyltransferase involved in cell wall biosynthesis